MTDTDMWLFTVAIAGLLGLIVSARAGLRWTWGICVQQAMILVISLLGFAFTYFGGALMGADRAQHAANYCAWLAWIMFLAFSIGQRLVLNRFSVELSLLKIREANAHAKWVRMFAWGLPGVYWTDMARVMELYAQGNSADADRLIAQWQSDSRVPQGARDGLVGFTMLGHVMRNDWQGIRESFEQNQPAIAGTRAAVPLQLASRAFAEEHRFVESLACLTALFQNSSRVSPSLVDGYFIPFFALSGACGHLQALFKQSKDVHSLPSYSRLFWLGRCYAVRGDVENAVRLLAEAREKTPPSMELWHERIDKQLQEQQLQRAGLLSQAPTAAPRALVDEAAKLYGRWRLTADTVRPARAGAALKVLMVSLIVAFILTNPYRLFSSFVSPQSQVVLKAYEVAFMAWGQLDSRLFSGEWWRIITYMFLHGGWAHLLLNTGALYLFGKSVENMYGTTRFCLIFFVAGALSGVVQLLAQPQEPAIGASGAILGIFGAAIAGIYKLKHILPAPIRKAELRWMLSVAVLQIVFDQLVNNIAAVTDKSGQGVRIAAFAHCGGIVAGFALGMLLPLRRLTELNVVDIVEPSG